jgi:hypothetical protein
MTRKPQRLGKQHLEVTYSPGKTESLFVMPQGLTKSVAAAIFYQSVKVLPNLIFSFSEALIFSSSILGCGNFGILSNQAAEEISADDESLVSSDSDSATIIESNQDEIDSPPSSDIAESSEEVGVPLRFDTPPPSSAKNNFDVIITPIRSRPESDDPLTFISPIAISRPTFIQEPVSPVVQSPIHLGQDKPHSPHETRLTSWSPFRSGRSNIMSDDVKLERKIHLNSNVQRRINFFETLETSISEKALSYNHGLSINVDDVDISPDSGCTMRLQQSLSPPRVEVVSDVDFPLNSPTASMIANSSITPSQAVVPSLLDSKSPFLQPTPHSFREFNWSASPKEKHRACTSPFWSKTPLTPRSFDFNIPSTMTERNIAKSPPAKFLAYKRTTLTPELKIDQATNETSLAIFP